VTTITGDPDFRGSSGGFVPIRTNTRRDTPDKVFRYVVKSAGFLTFGILLAIGVFLFVRAWPAFHYMGWRFFTTTQFNTNTTSALHAKFGVEAALFGSIIIAVIAIIVAVPVSVGAALFVNEYAPRSLFGIIPFKSFLISLVDLMAAVPSIIYGLWGFFVLQPFLAPIAKWLSVHAGFIPFFHVPKGTVVFTSSYFIAGVLVAIMILPIVTSITREIFSLTPSGEREGAMALGATRARIIKDIILPFAKGGMVGAIMLGLGRALGEAVAVSIILSLVFGVSFQTLHSGGLSIAALIAARFGSGGTYGLSALLACGFVLFVFTLIINLIASTIVSRSRMG
jgi:phosphate transport system permease protein